VVTSEPDNPQRPREIYTTVAFLDLVGFTELVVRHSVAEVVDVLNDFMATASRLTQRHGGELGKFLGDGVLIYFAEGAFEEDDAEGSARVRAAAGCIRLSRALGGALDERSRAWRAHGLGLQLHVRVGVASGYCALGDWGSQARLDYTLIGTPVNLASRLQSLAAPGSIVVSSATAALIGQVAELSAHLDAPRKVALKGLGSVVVHEISASAKVRAIPLPVRSGKPDA
jgi:class 3 adenylate cyclase